MSRYNGDDYEEMFPNQGELWHANLQRAIKGKRGQRDLRTLEAALLALPEKRLIEGRIASAEGLCAVGAFAVHRRVVEKGEDKAAVLDELDRAITLLCGHCCHAEHLHGEHGCSRCAEQIAEGRTWPKERCPAFEEDGSYSEEGDLQTMYAGKRAGMTETLAWRIGQLNDEDFGGLSPEARYERVLAWVRDRITEAVPA